ncbi:PAS/PAC sensor hybrid histidine kinase [Caballeronia telluris]|uniref:histidine kinase n=2 Tax=Caballeronia telluris TaxID=326475 RepID=A0A158JQ06_9BURK|nr:PAS/PAC sensor hybrid histidine kinase [Caballeronia telluris]SAL71721.1 PAS/PAC sensor hybrid histidine kinase [Caballeronia telluris]
MLLSTGPDAIVLAVSDAFSHAFSVEARPVVGVSLYDLSELALVGCESTREALRGSIALVVASGTPDCVILTAEYGEHAALTEAKCSWRVEHAPVHDESGELVCVRQTVTACKAAAEIASSATLPDSELRYRTLFEQINQGFCIIEMLFHEDGTAADYRFLTVNPAFEAQTGLVKATGRTMLELAPHHEKHWFETYGEVARTGMPAHFQNEAAMLDRWYNVHAFRLDPSRPNQVAILFSDITEQRNADQRRKRSERGARAAALLAEAATRRLDALLEVVPVGIVVSDRNGAIERENRMFAQLWGQHHPTRTTLADLGSWRARWADHSTRHGHALELADWTTARALRGEEAVGDLLEIESFDEPPVRRVLLSSGAPIRDENGEITGAVVAQLDITERIAAEEELLVAAKRKDEFLAMLSHELRNPLAPIASAADLIRVFPNDEPRVSKASAIIARQAKHMASLIEDLLDVSRVTQGLVQYEFEVLDLNRAAADAIEQVRPIIERKKHRFSLHTSPGAALVRGDEKRLIQVLANLLINAAKYTPEGGTIDFTVRIESGNVKLVVSDNGIGMTPDVTAHAFELFSQAERSADRSQGGLGIGLALVRSLVTAHGGSVYAWSAGPGLGSTFVVCLPYLEVTHAGLYRAEHPTAGESSSLAELKMLIVDDNADAAEALGMLVETAGNDVQYASDATTALEVVERWRPDVCLLDVGLPDIDGYELAGMLRNRAETAKVVLVAVTGYGLPQDKEKALAAGFDHHFVKPLDFKSLLGVLGEIASPKK